MNRIFLELMSGKITAVEPGTCMVQFLATSGNWASQLATIGTAIAAFYLPVSIMIYLYYRVFCETKRRQRELKSLQAGQVGFKFFISLLNWFVFAVIAFNRFLEKCFTMLVF